MKHALSQPAISSHRGGVPLVRKLVRPANEERSWAFLPELRSVHMLEAGSKTNDVAEMTPEELIRAGSLRR